MTGRRPDGSEGRVWDLLVVGGGSAGLVAAKVAAGFGARVLLVERDRTGGDCLWRGCVPSKALLAAAHAAAGARGAARYGVYVGPVRVDFSEVMAHVRAAIATIEPVDSPAALRAAGAAVMRGTARFTGAGAALVGGERVRFRQALIATGSEPVCPPVTGLPDAFAAALAVTTDSVWELAALPPRLLVVGGGSVGCELGQAFARLGSAVSLVEAGPRVLADEDPAAAELLLGALQADGIDVRTAARVDSVQVCGAEGRAVLSDGTGVRFDRILIAVGRRPVTADLGLAEVGVEVEAAGFVRVDDRLRTTNPRIWAAGDVTGHPRFTHTAGVHGSLAAANAVLGLRRKVDTAAVPRVTFTRPEIAAVGAPTRQAEGGVASVRVTGHDEVDRAVTDGHLGGMTRIALDRRGRVLGATIVGPRAGESLSELVLAVRTGQGAAAVAGTIHAYPTYGDGAWKASIAYVQGRLDTLPGRVVIAVLVRLRRRLLPR